MSKLHFLILGCTVEIISKILLDFSISGAIITRESGGKTMKDFGRGNKACLSLSKNCHSMFFCKNLWKSLKSTSDKKHTCLLFVMKQFFHAALNTSNSFVAFSSLLKNTVQKEFVLYRNQLNELPRKSIEQFHYNARFCWMEFSIILLFKIYLKESKLFMKATETCTICCPLK